MGFNKIEVSTWPRRETFYYFSKIAETAYSITLDLDVTDLLKVLKKRNYKFFPTYLWLVTKCLNKQIEFKVAVENGILGYYDTLTPLYANFHDDDKTFSLMWTTFNESYEVFYNSYLDNKEKYSKNHGILSNKDELPPKNSFTISEVPWISFKHFSVMSNSKDYFFPSIEGGKIYEENNKMLFPLSLTLHHATTDGYHIKKFLEDLDLEIKKFINSYGE